MTVNAIDLSNLAAPSETHEVGGRFGHPLCPPKQVKVHPLLLHVLPEGQVPSLLLEIATQHANWSALFRVDVVSTMKVSNSFSRIRSAPWECRATEVISS
ncbi:hypothetical protein [Allobranchiibius sp. GilTou73]|uniref:hypothetical protein n=1 Tax=Allobranchiibius sp. GilTou73 TaxID=2904523 RepID=UPI001F24C08A|nr:hypothetical protein [Allobranchiibius sp. GilTou73]UIJ35122.1 hypothetical protein LVQ62_01550 [Allobranchiibius sp. GilTou73]